MAIDINKIECRNKNINLEESTQKSRKIKAPISRLLNIIAYSCDISAFGAIALFERISNKNIESEFEYL